MTRAEFEARMLAALASPTGRAEGVTEADVVEHVSTWNKLGRVGIPVLPDGRKRLLGFHDSTAPLERATSFMATLLKPKKDPLEGFQMLTAPEEDFGVSE